MHHVVHVRHVGRARLEARARELRCSLSYPQELLWHAVAGARLGVYFRREVPLLGRFIVDMLAPSLRLVVEVDGRHHERQRRADARRDKALARAGYSVLRLEAALVIRELPLAVARIREAIAGLKRKKSRAA